MTSIRRADGPRQCAARSTHRHLECRSCGVLDRWSKAISVWHRTTASTPVRPTTCSASASASPPGSRASLRWRCRGYSAVVRWCDRRRQRRRRPLDHVGAGVAAHPRHLAARIGFVALGLIVVWAGITGVVSADVGAGPLELVMLGLMDRGISIRIARWGIELTLLLIGSHSAAPPARHRRLRVRHRPGAGRHPPPTRQPVWAPSSASPPTLPAPASSRSSSLRMTRLPML